MKPRAYVELVPRLNGNFSRAVITVFADRADGAGLHVERAVQVAKETLTFRADWVTAKKTREETPEFTDVWEVRLEQPIGGGRGGAGLVEEIKSHSRDLRDAVKDFLKQAGYTVRRWPQ